MTSPLPSTSLGIDLEDIGRFTKKPYKTNVAFYQKIFSQPEIDYCLSKKNPYPHFAVRFCAKEAFIKAHPKKISGYIDIEVLTHNGKRFVVYHGIRYTASLSHDNDKAIAVVML